jgi:hypothetical protein
VTGNTGLFIIAGDHWEKPACFCTCALCATYGHDRVAVTWWVSHVKSCPEVAMEAE